MNIHRHIIVTVAFALAICGCNERHDESPPPILSASPVEQPPAVINRHEVRITQGEYGDAWPFTVDSGVLAGNPTDLRLSNGTALAEVTFTAEGKTYYVNGTAKGTGRYAELDDIWARDASAPKELGLKKNMGPIIERGLKLARGINEPFVAPKAPPPLADASGPVRCEQFEVSATFEPNVTETVRRVKISVKTDLPNTTHLMVSIERSFVNAVDNKERTILYMEEKSTVAEWRADRVVDLDQTKWQAKLEEARATLRKFGQKLALTRLDEFVTVSFVVPVNQPDERFGLRNANLIGAMVQDSNGVRVVRRDAKLKWPVTVQ